LKHKIENEDQLWAMLKDRCRVAVEKYGPFKSYHEGYAVILEELDELWDEVKKRSNKRNHLLIREECVDIAVAAIKLALMANFELPESPKK
jgi:hypothetical protein